MIDDLEERTCICGCGRKFKVLPTSPLFYASKRCSFKKADTNKAKLEMTEADTKELIRLSKVFAKPPQFDN